MENICLHSIIPTVRRRTCVYHFWYLNAYKFFKLPQLMCFNRFVYYCILYIRLTNNFDHMGPDTTKARTKPTTHMVYFFSERYA